jgi:hypothetical protein
MALTVKSTHKLSNGMSITDGYLMVDQQGSVTTKNVLILGCRLFASKEARDLGADALTVSQKDPLHILINPIEKELSEILSMTVPSTTVTNGMELFTALSNAYYQIILDVVGSINEQLPEDKKIIIEPFQEA